MDDTDDTVRQTLIVLARCLERVALSMEEGVEEINTDDLVAAFPPEVLDAARHELALRRLVDG